MEKYSKIQCHLGLTVLYFNIPGISTSVASKAHDVGKMVFTTVKAEFQKKSENISASLPWKLQTVSASIDLMVWTAEQDDQGNFCS